MVEHATAGDRGLHHSVGALVEVMGILHHRLLDDLHRDSTVRGRSALLVRGPLAPIGAPRRGTTCRPRRRHGPPQRGHVGRSIPSAYRLSYGRNRSGECKGCVALRFAVQVRPPVAVQSLGAARLILGGRRKELTWVLLRTNGWRRNGARSAGTSSAPFGRPTAGPPKRRAGEPESAPRRDPAKPPSGPARWPNSDSSCAEAAARRRTEYSRGQRTGRGWLPPGSSTDPSRRSRRQV